MGAEIEIAHYSLDVEILKNPVASVIPDAPGRIRCTCTLDLRSTAPEPVRSARFILYRLLRVSTATEGQGAPVDVRQHLCAVEASPAQHVNVIDVDFATPVPPGHGRTLCLTYEGPLVGYREVMPYVHDSVQRHVAVLRPEVLWYPVPGGAVDDTVRRAYRTRGFDVVVHAPAGWWATMAGTQREAEPAGSTRFHSVEGYGDGLLLVAGEYTERTAENYVNVHHLPGHAGWADAVVEAAAFAAGTLTDWLGPRATRREPLVFVEVPAQWGSQVVHGFILQIQRDDPQAVFANVAHEVCHHWTPGADPNRFCDEGLAHYLETVIAGARHGDDARWGYLRDYRARILGDPAAAQVPLAHAAEHPDELLEAASRSKGPLALAVLHAVLGEADFRDFLRSWIASDAARRRGTAADFCEHVRGWMRLHRPGVDAERYVAEWFGTAGPLPLEGGAARPIAEALRACAARYAG